MVLTSGLIKRSLLTTALIAAFIGSAIPTSRTHAVTINVGCSVSDFVTAVNTANATTADDTLQLSPNCIYTFTASNNTTDGSNALPVIPAIATGGRLVINGGVGVIIQRSTAGGTPLFRLLRMSTSANVTINSVTIKGFEWTGSSSSGGAIRSSGTLSINNSTFQSNASPSFNGGAIYQDASSLTVTTSTFVSNSAAYGGAISVQSGANLNVSDSVFNLNTGSGNAGAIDHSAGALSLTRNTFYRNTTSGGGGAIFVNSTNTGSILNSTFEENTATNGGAIYINTTGVIVRRALFKNNIANDKGGGVYNYYTYTVTDSLFTGNSANQGGGLRTGDNATVTNVTFIYNIATTGGAIYQNSYTLNLANSTIYGNTADTGGGLYRNDGAGGTLNVDNSVFAVNTANVEHPDFSGTASTGSLNNFVAIGAGTVGLTNGSNGNKVGTVGTPLDPALEQLTFNGGATQTLRPRGDSQLVNAGSNASVPSGTPFDQRFTGHPRIVNGTVDIGAVELQREDNPGLYNTGNAAFLLRSSLTSGPPNISFLYGPGGTDILPLMGDWDGDGTDTQGIYVKSTAVFVLSNALNGASFAAFPYGPGGADYVPVTGDWDGDGRDSVGIYNKTNGLWLLINATASVAPSYSFFYGPGGNLVPIPGDWDGNGTDTPGLYNPTNGAWILANQLNAAPFTAFPYGENLTPVKGDWNQDGIDTPGVWNPATGSWLLINQNASIAPQVVFTYGSGSLLTLVGRWVTGTTAPEREGSAPAAVPTEPAPQIAPTFAP